MNAPASAPLPWSRGRWWGAVFLVTVAQTGLIFWLSERKPIVPRRPDSTTTVQLVAEAPPGRAIAELLNIDDPTLVALPDPRGFSGPAWITAPPLEHQRRDWTEPARSLALPVAELGATFAQFVRTNVVGPGLLADKPAPRLSEVGFSPVPMPATSTFRIEGDLAKRELLTPLEVLSISHTNILTTTVVQVCVDRLGFVFSPVQLSGSGSKTADERALDLAKSMRFKPVAGTNPALPRNPLELTWGTIIFRWITLEMPASNSPAARPPP